MDNYFITQPPFGNLKRKTFLVSLLNKGLRYIKAGYTISPVDTLIDMNTIEQRINFYHLLDGVLSNNISGEAVELGCFTGQCAMLFQKIIKQHKSPIRLHLYDSFNSKFKTDSDVESQLIENFTYAGLELPVIHKGLFQDTLPKQLPDQISFIHIDCGFGDDKFQHKEIILSCLKSVYPRMSKGAVCVLMDYYDAAVNGAGFDAHPGVKLACDEFLTGKSEEVNCLYGSQYYHGFFRKD